MKIALIGNPNAGKSSVFNHLTGLRQKTGNFPGVTVDKKTGSFSFPNGSSATVTDLPGTYSLYPNSMDERIAADFLCDRSNPAYPDAVICLADASNLERHLLLCSQLIDLELPVVVALTMTDVAEANGFDVNAEELSKQLGIPVVKVNGRTGKGIKELIQLLPHVPKKTTAFIDTRRFAPQAVDAIKKILPAESSYSALLIAHHAERFNFLEAHQKEEIIKIKGAHSFNSLPLQVQETFARYDKITELLKKAVRQQNKNEQPSFTEKADKILTHRVYGMLIFLAVLFLVFQAIFAWAEYPMDWIDYGFKQLGSFLHRQLPPGIFNNLLTEGIIPGIAGVCIFIPQITILFLLIVFLEDIGYMSRAIFLSDKVMRKFGLNGRSIVSLFSGFACAIPAIMSTRTITNWKERIITIMVTPLMSCSARIPVFTVLVALVLPLDSHIGIFNTKGILMFGLYFLGVAAALASAYVMKKLIKTNERSYLVMELPSYKTPNWKNIGFTAFDKVKVFVTQAGKVILVVAIVLWFLASYGPEGAMNQATQIPATAPDTLSAEQAEMLIASQKLEASYAGHLGRIIEPVIKPLGFDWKIGIALITSFAAREVFVGTMATLYSVGRDPNEKTVSEKLQTEKNPNTGLPVFTPAVAFSLLIFYLFALQCMSTIAVVHRETKSWKWAAIQFVYMTGLAYVASLLAYQIAKHFI